MSWSRSFYFQKLQLAMRIKDSFNSATVNEKFKMAKIFLIPELKVYLMNFILELAKKTEISMRVWNEM